MDKKTSKKNCCTATEKDKKCTRKSDKKEFDIEKRKYSKKTCLSSLTKTKKDIDDIKSKYRKEPKIYKK